MKTIGIESEVRTFVVCSCPVNPILTKVPFSMRTWINAFLRIPVHTFVVDENTIPLTENKTNGYWYCAGGFKDIDENGVKQALVELKPNLARCLVSPDIKKDHPSHAIKVISGEYNHNYVCHNIANRVLFASNPTITLADLDMDIPGYSIVVKSTLGVYGQNQHEWLKRIERCKETKPEGIKLRNRDIEIEKLHNKAGGSLEEGALISEKLKNVDSTFFTKTSEAINALENTYLSNEVITLERLVAVILVNSSLLNNDFEKEKNEIIDLAKVRLKKMVTANPTDFEFLRSLKAAYRSVLESDIFRRDALLFQFSVSQKIEDLFEVDIWGELKRQKAYVLNDDSSPDDFRYALRYFNREIAYFHHYVSSGSEYRSSLWFGFNSYMSRRVNTLLYDTKIVVGKETTEKIFPGCKIPESPSVPDPDFY